MFCKLINYNYFKIDFENIIIILLYIHLKKITEICFIIYLFYEKIIPIHVAIPCTFHIFDIWHQISLNAKDLVHNLINQNQCNLIMLNEIIQIH